MICLFHVQDHLCVALVSFMLESNEEVEWMKFASNLVSNIPRPRYIVVHKFTGCTCFSVITSSVLLASIWYIYTHIFVWCFNGKQYFIVIPNDSKHICDLCKMHSSFHIYCCQRDIRVAHKMVVLDYISWVAGLLGNTSKYSIVHWHKEETCPGHKWVHHRW